MTVWRNTAGERIDVDSEGLFYPFLHLHPESDPIVRAICDRLGIDWRLLRDFPPPSPPRHQWQASCTVDNCPICERE